MKYIKNEKSVIQVSKATIMDYVKQNLPEYLDFESSTYQFYTIDDADDEDSVVLEIDFPSKKSICGEVEKK